jgi:hypothetical protein
MRYIRVLCFLTGVLPVCGVRADTLPTLIATSASVGWPVDNFTGLGTVSGPGFQILSQVTGPANPYVSCNAPAPVPLGGCVVPSPPLFLQAGPAYIPASGSVTLGGVTYAVGYQGNAQIQYFTPTVTLPDSVNLITTVPVVLSGFETACLIAPNHSDLDLCSPLPFPPTPGYPQYIANIQINLPGTLTFYGGNPAGGFVEAKFVSTPLPEPGSIIFVLIGFLILLAGYRMRKRQTSL